MKIPKIMISLTFVGENIDFKKLDYYTNIQTNIHHTAERVEPGQGLSKGQRYWEATTGYIDSWHVDHITNEFIEPLKPSIDILADYLKNNKISSKLTIVTEMSAEAKPSLCFDSDMIHMLSQINAVIDIDQYILE